MPQQSPYFTRADDNQSDDSGEQLRAAWASIPNVTDSSLRVETLAGVEKITALLASDRPLGEILIAVAEGAKALLSCNSTAVCLLSEDGAMLDFAAVAGTRSQEMTGQRVLVGDALPGPTAVSGKPLLAFDETSNPEAERPARQGFRQAGVRSAAMAPILALDQSIGAIAAIDRSDGAAFTGADLLVLQILCSVAAAAVERDHMARTAAQRTRERNILFRVASDSARSFDTEGILASTLDSLIGSVEMSSATVFLFNDDRSLLYIAASYGLTEDECEIQISAESEFAQAVSMDGGSALIVDEDAIAEQFWDIFPPSLTSPRSAMLVPIVTRDGVVGAITVGSRVSRAYTKDDLALLAAVSSQTSVKIENGLLLEDATRRASEATAVYELSLALNSSMSASGIARLAVDSIAPLLRVDKCALFLHNPIRNRLEIVAARNLPQDTVEKMHPSAERRGIAWWVYEFETPTSVLDVAADNRNRSYPVDAEGVESLLSVPVLAGEKVIGVIHAMSSRRRSFTVAEMELLFTVGNQVGSALDKALVLEETRRQGNDLRRSFRRVTKALSTSSTPELTEQVVTELAAELMKVDRAILYRFEKDSPSSQDVALMPVASYGFNMPEMPVGEIADTERETTAQVIARKRRVVMIEENAIHDPKFCPAELIAAKVARASFYLGIPLTIGDDILGVIEVYARESRKVSRADMRNVLAFTTQAALALKTSWSSNRG